MTKELIIALFTIAVLVAIFFTSYILNKNTKANCADNKINKERCSACNQTICPLHKKGEEV